MPNQIPADPSHQDPLTSASQENMVVIDTASNQGFKVEVLAYKTLAGSNDPRTAPYILRIKRD